jgi:hypothetical protein
MSNERSTSLLPAKTRARVRIVQQLVQAGWTIQDKKALNGDGLKPDETREFIKTTLCDGASRITGTAVIKILPSVRRFAAHGAHSEKKQGVLSRLGASFDRFFGLAVHGREG